ncbi:hypothetical protein G6F35_016738 [Rhizopus arrhizus]|nr:hypothetical protein G6F35_016738 [Rhizopus arrhizus]
MSSIRGTPRPQQDPSQQGDEESRDRQHQRGRQAVGDHVPHGALLPVAVAQVQRGDGLQIAPQLHHQGLIELELLAQLFQELRVGRPGFASQHADRVAGRHVHQGEVDDGDCDQHRDRLAQHGK